MIGQIFYDDKDYSTRAEWCNNNNCHIEEIERDEKGRRYTIVENKISQMEIFKQEYNSLKQWFDIDYTRKEQKYNRLIALDRLTDNGENPHDKLIELYETAETNRNRIQELENLLKVE